MGFFSDVDIESVNSKKKDQMEEDTTTENLLDDLMPSDEEEADDSLDDMDDMFPEMPASYDDEEDSIEIDDSQDEDDLVTEPIENEPVYERLIPKKEVVKSKEDIQSEKKKIAKTPAPKMEAVPKPSEIDKSSLEKEEKITNRGNDSVDHNVILSGTTVMGDIISSSPLDIYGNVNGNVESTESIFIGENSSVKGSITTHKSATIYGDVGNNIVANEVSVNACKIRGSITAKDIHLEKDSIVIGDIESSGNVIVTGAVKGNIDSKEKVEVAETAIIQGNIKSAIISIAPGAAIDGTCTQEYAKIKPADFFADIE